MSVVSVSAACPRGQLAKSEAIAPPEVIFHVANPAHDARVTVELARTQAEHAHGFMERTSLPSGAGMLFLFDHAQPLVFWMKNTLIPLDMIFIDSSMRVVGIEENAEPLTLKPRGPTTPAQYVVEVPAGWARQNGVALGCEVQFNHVVP